MKNRPPHKLIACAPKLSKFLINRRFQSSRLLCVIRANCKTIFLNWPTSGEHDFSSLFRDIGGNLIGYGGGIMANLI
ncbi:hypothetical protein, partial [Massilia genomosp. 1]|uniref:hypothetical protein n=1 Tax=Massilia genomosp. 1 TaxID=2609280 RepID=UPI001C9E3595